MDIRDPFLSQLREARSFDDAAQVTLGAMLAVCQAAVSSSAFARSCKLLRLRLHVRTSDGYRHLVVREVENPRRNALGSTNHSKGPNANAPTGAWQWMTTQGVAVAFDVETDSAYDLENGKEIGLRGPIATQEGATKPVPFASRDTRNGLLERGTTHLAVIPMYAPGRQLCGMFEIEAMCRQAINDPRFVWVDCFRELSQLAYDAGPHLLQIPVLLTTSVLPDDDLPVVGMSMQPTLANLREFASQNATILLSGPSGVGKTQLAKWCHRQSKRTGPFISVNVATLTDDLMPGTLFGWARGAFTTAVTAHEGAIARAEGGTLFIDEIDKLSLKGQATLLQLLDQGTFQPLGSTKMTPADVRFIVGTNVSLRERVQKGLFLEDLFHRIDVLPIAIPPLDARRDEIIDWADFFLQRDQRSNHNSAKEPERVALSAGAAKLLLSLRWPGNLRQLDHIIRRTNACRGLYRTMLPESLTIHEYHILHALKMELDAGTETRIAGDDSTALGLVMQAARACAEVAKERASVGQSLALESFADFEYLVLHAADAQWGQAEAFRILGLTQKAQQRNGGREMSRAKSAVVRFQSACANPIGHSTRRKTSDEEFVDPERGSEG